MGNQCQHVDTRSQEFIHVFFLYIRFVVCLFKLLEKDVPPPLFVFGEDQGSMTVCGGGDAGFAGSAADAEPSHMQH